MRVTITLKHGEQRAFKVLDRSFTIGRSQGCSIVLPYDTFSRQHCLVELLDEDYFITDLGSSNGVSINGKRIEANVPHPFQLNEHLSLGDAVLRIQDGTVPEMKLSLGTQPDMVFKELKPRNNYNPISGRSSRTRKRQSIEAEKKSALDPVNLLVVILIVAAVFFYRQQVSKEVQPPVVNEQSSGQSP